MKYKYVFPVGSRCHINSELKKHKLGEFAIRYSPFNGTGITDESNIYPLSLFIENPKEFIQLYSDINNWKMEERFTTDNRENISYDLLLSRNTKLNLIRHHIREEHPYDFIERSINAMDFFLKNKNDTLILIDLVDYLRCNISQLQELLTTLEKNKINYYSIIRISKLRQLDIRTNHFNTILTKEHFKETLNFVKNNYNVIISRVIDIEKAYSNFFDVILNNFFKDDIV